MIEDYTKAWHMGESQYRRDITFGRYPYLTALDDIVKPESILAENHIGLVEIPIADIAGTKTHGRQEAFASNFMPLLPPKTEFSMKWSALYDSAVQEGIRDAILVYEYMGRFYVQEGNKRVSVSRFTGMVSILADVIRLLPQHSDDKTNRIYFEFVDFFKLSGIYGIRFSEEGAYQKLCQVLGLSMEKPWASEVRNDVKADFFRFAERFLRKGGGRLEITRGDAFLIYLRIYGAKSLEHISTQEIDANLDKIWHEFLKEPEDIRLVETPDVLQKDSSFFKRLMQQNADRKLTVAFIYEKNPETSSWAYQHELGRNYIAGRFGTQLETLTWADCDTPALVSAAIDEAAAAGAQVIFTTTGMMVEASVQAKVRFPKIHILNCSVNSSYNSIRTYYGRMYEAKFLMGALAASVTDGNEIGYAELCPLYGTLSNVNAFAIGAQMINPYARIHLEWSALRDHDWKKSLLSQGIRTISGPELTPAKKLSREFGVYRIAEDGAVSNIATPIFDWGRFYEIILRSILEGSWDNSRLTKSHEALNFWFGMESGVIDVILSGQLHYASRKMLTALREGVLSGRIHPFDGEIHSQEGLIKDAQAPRLSSEEIVNMHWLNDNVVGEIPKLEAFNQRAQELIRISGFLKGSL